MPFRAMRALWMRGSERGSACPQKPPGSCLTDCCDATFRGVGFLPRRREHVVLLLTALSGLAWTIVYIESIRVGFRQKTYAMPIAALGLNIAWEWTYAVRDLSSDAGQLQAWVNLIWALADVVILFTFFRYGPSEFPRFVSRRLFVTAGVVVIVTSFLVQWLFIAEFGTAGNKAAQYSAFLQNLFMSGLFIAMFVARRGPRGQSMIIAVAKWIGTLAPTILFGFIDGSAFVIGIGLLCSVFDLAYVGLLVWAKRVRSTFPDSVAGPVAPLVRLPVVPSAEAAAGGRGTS
jgi:hypothetical protein